MKQCSLPFLCNIHIERCGGTSLHHLLHNNFFHYLILRPWNNWPTNKRYLTQKELKWILRLYPMAQGIGGHTTRIYEGYEKIINNNIFYFTFLRDPIKRYMSHFNYQVVRMKKKISIEDFINAPHYNNFQTVRIAGTADKDKALSFLYKKCKFVGITEKFDESIILMKYLIGTQLNILYERKNAITSKNVFLTFEELSPSIKKKIIENNRVDTELYFEVKNKLFPAYKDNYPGDLEKEKYNLQTLNTNYHFPKTKIASRKIQRGLLYYIVEPLAHKLSQAQNQYP